ncbi:fungal specific transcription factor domain-containing protein [Cordyceps javanica]|uniref:Fungal specific transcription factor domain-containing protein n=1 Tax=Cordyceps javanica TaxID=43265 RepID=A0A545UMS0_9HYPO|nr:fungal specific transcription factor domain-containing protein [Cordyceps javanica]TQW02399.1 fungal specific transcription factor domain-containing protein [Cordyceps javanica]
MQQNTPEQPQGLMVGPAAANAAEDASGRRAIRCDKDWPCSNCRTAKRPCTSTGAGQRPKEPRQRVLISSQYERKIDQIESRLGSIETLLRNLSTSGGGAGTGGGGGGAASDAASRIISTPQTGSSGPTCESTADFDSSEEDAAFGGDSGLTVHTAFASEFLERAVKRTALRSAHNPKMEAALANLGQLVEMQRSRPEHRPRFPLQRAVPPGGVSKLPLPPMALVVELLKKNKASPVTLFTIMCDLVGVTDITTLCRAVYFPTEDVSDATFAVVSALLYNLFLEQHSLSSDPDVREEYNRHFQLCRANLETTLANLPMLLSAKIDNVQALLLGSLYAVDVSRPTVAWHFASAGAQLCLTGGFHRQDSLAHDPPETARIKRILFWHTYTLDKGLGLRLGRASVIHECDIDIPRVFEFDLLDSGGADTVPTMWVEISGLQSLIYEQLYSPAALHCPQDELVRRARALADECRRLGVRGDRARSNAYSYIKQMNISDVVDVFIRGDEVQYYVTQTLIYRVIPAPDRSVSRFCDECLEAARRAMSAHQDCARLIDLGSFVKTIYVHWNLMLTPFAPFFVLFCYVIETSSADDLKILREFVASLALARDSSEAVEKLYRLCQVMYDVLTLYVEAKSSQQHQQENGGAHGVVPIGDEFEMYLSQLGLMPIEDQAMTGAHDGAGGQAAAAAAAAAGGSVPHNPQVAQIADWFVNNRNMMGLLEEDLSHIDSYRWLQSGAAHVQQHQQPHQQHAGQVGAASNPVHGHHHTGSM